MVKTTEETRCETRGKVNEIRAYIKNMDFSNDCTEKDCFSRHKTEICSIQPPE